MGHRSKNAGTANAKYIPRGPDGEKCCSRCRSFRPASMFNVDRSRFDGLSYICTTCRAAKRTAPGPTQRERRGALLEGKKWCGGCRSWFPVTAIRGAKCQPCHNAYARAHYRTDPNFNAARKARSIARRRGVEPMPRSAQIDIADGFDGLCAYCDAPATTWDHVVPITKGGMTEPYNMLPCCAPCNSSKNAKNLWDWLQATGRTIKDQAVDRMALYHASHTPARGPDPFD